MKILAFGASSSKKSINKKLASHAASMVQNGDIEILDLNDFELPLFSEDKEEELGHPQLAKEFLNKISNADGLIISFAEHNGSYTAAYKNIFDWASRIDPKVYQNKPAIFLSASPGPGGASSTLKSAETSAKFWGADLQATLSVPSFYTVFDIEAGKLKEEDLRAKLQRTVEQLSQ
ncbi:MAG: NAD(P)H-dependent oxidoreductase [Sneathiella sp.]